MRWGAFALLAALASSAHAGPQLEPITSRDYAIDLYEGNPFGNTSALATGGAVIANAMGSSGTLVNDSAPAVRPTTDTDTWSWDYHADYLIGSLSTDYTNSGIDYAALGVPAPDTHTSTLTGGLALRIKDWGAAVNARLANTQLVDAAATLPSGGMVPVLATAWHVKAALAKWVPELDFAFGGGVQIAVFDVHPDCSGPGCNSLFDVSGVGGEVGATWMPRWQDFRIGASLSTSIDGKNITVDHCMNPMDCDGYIVPDEVYVPARLGVGIAYRSAETRWNQLVGGTFRDEKSVTMLADLIVTGPSPNAYGLDAFGIKMLERSGRHTSTSLRGGIEYEWVPGRFRIRGGSYWEPGRYEGVNGRLHGTFGLELRLFEFQAWGRRRARITLTGDVASGYRNLGLSVGFWH